jgi:hypothetical protein
MNGVESVVLQTEGKDDGSHPAKLMWKKPAIDVMEECKAFPRRCSVPVEVVGCCGLSVGSAQGLPVSRDDNRGCGSQRTLDHQVRPRCRCTGSFIGQERFARGFGADHTKK